MRLKDKVAIITGGGSGIGRATATLFAEEGARVSLAGRKIGPLEETARIVRSRGREALVVPTDVASSKQIQNLVRDTVSEFGKVDILFSNAAYFSRFDRPCNVVDFPEEEWDQLMAVNVKGTFLCAKYCIPEMIKSGGGSIINCSSNAGHVGLRNQAAYNASKGAIELLTKSIALDFAQYNIRANTVCPAMVEVDRNKEEIRQFKQQREPWKDMLRRHPIGRIGKPEDIAPAVVYLASDESSWVTGISLFVDGGYTCQ